MSVISAGTTLTTALVQTGDTNGNLVFKTGASGTTALTLGSDQSATFAGAVSFSGGAFAAGSAASPSITFTGDTNTGIFSPAADTIAFTEGGVESMRIDSSGNVGIGTSSPSNHLDVIGSGSQTIRVGSTNGDVANLSMLSNGNATWSLSSDTVMRFKKDSTEYMRIDSSGNVGIGTSSPASPIHVQRSNDGTIGTFRGTSNAQLLLGISSGNLVYDSSNGNATHVWQANGTERMRIDSSGNLLVGTTNATSNSGVGIKFVQSPTDPFVAVVASTNASGSTAYNLYSTATSSYRFYVSTSGTISAVNTTISSLSDQRYKENIVDLDVGLNKIMALKPRKFDWKEGRGKNTKGDRGFIAQEFEQVFPDLVDEWKDPAPEGEEPYKSVRADLIPVLVKAIQEQQAIITDQASTIAAFEARLTALENK